MDKTGSRATHANTSSRCPSAMRFSRDGRRAKRLRCGRGRGMNRHGEYDFAAIPFRAADVKPTITHLGRSHGHHRHVYHTGRTARKTRVLCCHRTCRSRDHVEVVRPNPGRRTENVYNDCGKRRGESWTACLPVSFFCLILFLFFTRCVFAREPRRPESSDCTRISYSSSLA